MKAISEVCREFDAVVAVSDEDKSRTITFELVERTKAE